MPEFSNKLIHSIKMEALKEVVMDTASATSNKNQQLQQQQVNKMQRQRLNQQQILSRRKWSDWSECSLGCFKTRHRTTCDDLIAQNSTITSPNSTNKSPQLTTTASNKLPADSYIKRQVASNGKQSTLAGLLAGSSSRLGEEANEDDEGDEDEGELLMKADQVEDDDYADEGDEDNEKDSCDNVDPSKTFQKIACSGGLCRPPAAITTPTTTMASSIDQTLLSQGATTIQPGSGWHHRGTETRPIKSGRHWDQQQQQPHRPLPKGPSEKPTNALANNDNGQDGQEEGGSSLVAAITTKGKLDHQGSNTRLSNSTERANKNGNHNYVASGHHQPFETTVVASQEVGPNESFSGREPVLAGRAETTSAIWPSTATPRNMWPQQLLNPGTDGPLGAQANIIHWTILIGALLTIILLIMLIMRKLFATALPSYHWMLAKQTIKSSSESRLGSGTATASETDQPDGFSPGPYSFRTKPISVGHMGAANRHMVAPGMSSLLIETADYHHKHHPHHQKRPEGSSRPPHHMSYAWRAHHNQPSGGPGDMGQAQATFQGGSSAGCGGSGFRRFMVDTNGCHLLGTSSTKFNTDQEQQQEVYVEPFSHSTGSSQQRRQQPPMPNHEPDTNSVLSANYNTLGSGYYGDSFQHPMAQDQYDKGFVLTRDFLPSANMGDRRVSGSYHRSMTRKPKASRRGSKSGKARQRSSSDASSAHGAVAGEQVAAAAAALGDFEFPEDPQYRDTRSASISSTDESPSVQSTTAQLLSHAASSSFEQPPEFEGSMQLVSNAAPISYESSPAQASPASLGGGGKLRNNKLTCLVAAQTVQSQPNSPMFVNQFHNSNNNSHRQPPPANHRQVHKPSALQFGSSSSSRSTKPPVKPSGGGGATANEEPEYAQPELQVNCQAPASSSNDNTPSRSNGTPQTRLTVANLPTNDCDNDDRHFYEEIQNSQHKWTDN